MADEKKVSIGTRINGFLNFLWNSETKEFLGRDGASWAKISIFYCIFYTCLGGFFIGLLAVFSTTLDSRTPTYFNTRSVMDLAQNTAGGGRVVNPGMGFRPQLEPESDLIYFDLNSDEALKPTAASFNHFLTKFYFTNESENALENCVDKELSNIREELNQGKYCKFPTNSLLDNVGANLENNFNFQTSPMVLLKVNKIYGWTPEPYTVETFPKFVQELYEKSDDKESFLDMVTKNILVHCEGEYPADVDSLNFMKPTYHSSVENEYDDQFGLIPFHYFPYLNQNQYQSPFVLLKLNIESPYSRNVLTNVACKAYAKNIDSDDKLNRRGMAIFTVFIAKTD